MVKSSSCPSFKSLQSKQTNQKQSTRTAKLLGVKNVNELMHCAKNWIFPQIFSETIWYIPFKCLETTEIVMFFLIFRDFILLATSDHYKHMVMRPKIYTRIRLKGGFYYSPIIRPFLELEERGGGGRAWGVRVRVRVGGGGGFISLRCLSFFAFPASSSPETTDTQAITMTASKSQGREVKCSRKQKILFNG